MSTASCFDQIQCLSEETSKMNELKCFKQLLNPEKIIFARLIGSFQKLVHVV
jgi:hypothetical protein